MTPTEIISLVVTLVGVGCFAAVFTILYGKYSKGAIKEVKSGKRDIELIDQSITEQDIKIKRRKKALSITYNIFFYGLLAIVIPLFAFAMINKIQGNLMPFGDTTVMVVASGSMSFKNEANDYYLKDPAKQEVYNLDNQFSRFDMIFIQRPKSFEDIKLYDVIAFYNDYEKDVYIHRVIEIDKVNQKFTTRGDANNATDPYHPLYSDVKGVYTSAKVDGIGMLVMFFQSPSGIITVTSVVYCLWMIGHYSSKIEKAEKERTAKLATIIDEASLEKGAELMAANFTETIFYQGYAYTFNEKGFVSKEEVDEPMKKGEIIKVKEEEGKEKVKEVISVNEKAPKPTETEDLVDLVDIEEPKVEITKEKHPTSKDSPEDEDLVDDLEY